MILNLDDDFLINMDKVVAVVPQDRFVVLEGTVLTIERDEHLDAITKAFKWIHKSYTHDKNMKKIRGK